MMRRLQSWKRKDYCSSRENDLQLTARGRLLSNEVFEKFIDRDPATR